MRIVCLSDTHNKGSAIEVPDGDVLVHAGDHTIYGEQPGVARAFEWLGSLPHKHKVIIAGNHDWFCQDDPWATVAMAQAAGLHYLRDSGIVLEGLKFWGYPWTPKWHEWAFQLPPEELRRHLSKVDPSTDVLISHGPPAGVLDKTLSGVRAGCEELLKLTTKLQPKLHVFGHIHEGYGVMAMKGERSERFFVNASICNLQMKPVNKPIVIDLDLPGVVLNETPKEEQG